MGSAEAGGIPWDEIMNRVDIDPDSDDELPTVTGMSGQLLHYDIGEYEEADQRRVCINIEDAASSCFYLDASVGMAKGDLVFRFNTKGYQNDPDRKHPDLYAARFVGKALQFFEERWGVVPTHFTGSWSHEEGHSDNFELFKKHYTAAETRGDSVFAARNTWSGKIMEEQYGFNDITRNDITVRVSGGVPYSVKYTFWRQGKRPQVA